MKNKKNRKSPRFDSVIAFFTTEMIIAGSASSMIVKATQRISLSPAPGEEPIPFNHPYILSFWMFTGEALCLAVYFVMKLFPKKNDYSHVQTIEI